MAKAGRQRAPGKKKEDLAERNVAHVAAILELRRMFDSIGFKMLSKLWGDELKKAEAVVLRGDTDGMSASEAGLMMAGE